MQRWRVMLCLGVLLGGCGGGGGSNSQSLHAPVVHYDPPISVSTTLPPVAAVDWDDTAVRKVLRTFAFGGMASDQQIQAWVAMGPQAAIVEMLTFDSYNPKLSPTTDADPINGTDRSLQALMALWSGTSSPLAAALRSNVAASNFYGPTNAVIQAAVTPGINPVRERVVLWETNYHLVANINAAVTPRQIVFYFDTIANALSAREPYQNVLAAAAQSAAIAEQYKHYLNKYDIVNGVGVFSGNEDFGREYHQLFFGILGLTQPDDTAGNYHELVTIKNTAEMLTGMTMAPPDDVELIFSPVHHHVADLEILHTTISGPTAKEKINALAQVAINYPDSLNNLPVIIIGGLASDTLSPADIAQLQAFWKAMPSKDLLTFLRAYAISQQFHSVTRQKNWSPLERNLLLTNLMTLSSTEANNNYYNPAGVTGGEDGYYVFFPPYNVFGSVTGLESAGSDSAFLGRFNRAVGEYWRYTTTSDSLNPSWYKNWGSVAPKNVAGQYVVKNVAEWLWQRFVADGLQNFGPLERLHVYTLLDKGLDPAVACAAANTVPNYDLEYTATQASSDPTAVACSNASAADTLALGSSTAAVRNNANYHVGLAIDFISALPFTMMDVGR